LKKLFTFIILTLGFFTQSLADDISDFQIEGIAIGDSALSYFTLAEIKKKKQEGFIYTKKDFYSITFYNKSKFKQYDAVQLHLKANDEKYKIYSVGGRKNFEDDYEDCIKQLEIVLPEIQKIFPNSKTIDGGVDTWKNNLGYDVTAKSYWIKLSSKAEIALECYDQHKDVNIIDGLVVALDSKEFADWLTK
jgi:hypothetical protein